MSLMPMESATPPAVPSAPRIDSPYVAYFLYLKSPAGRQSTESRLDKVARLLGWDDGTKHPGASYPWHTLTYAQANALTAALRHRKYSPLTIAADLAAVRGVLEQCHNLGLITMDDIAAIRKGLKTPQGSRLPAGREVADEEIAAMISARLSADGPAGFRDAVLLAVMADTGARVSEVAGMRVEHYSRRSRRMRIFGKGDKERLTQLGTDVAALVDQWLNVLGRGTGPLFPKVSGVSFTADPFAAEGIRSMLRRLWRPLGLDRVTSHDFRRTLITAFLRKFGDISSAQAIAGHADARTTAGYDRRKEEEALDMLARLNRGFAAAWAGGHR